MNKFILALTLVACSMIAKTASATTYDDYTIHGNNCVTTTPGSSLSFPQSGQSVVMPTYSQYGPYAPGWQAVNVTCPLTLPYQVYTYAYLYVQGYNRSSTDHLSCTLSATNFDGLGLKSLTVTLPNNEQPSQLSAASVNSFSSSLFLTCHIPAATSSGLSHLSSIWLVLGY